MIKKRSKTTHKKIKRKISKGIIYIKSNFNNTLITLTNLKGDTIAWSSAGSCGFKGARKGTPFAAKIAIETILKRCLDFGIKQIKILINGPGPGRETVIRSLQKAGLQIILIRDITPIPHNGCRPPKKRRV
uniref:Small ribosomal subunit protein uS11c n=1 Tax=Ostreobium sp. HV05007bc TaxID=1940403 RepID=A0A1X9ZI42_9CHLO|nr:ribosomal protein S11 [Ostreobium sp. HV05007bc]UXE31088.1 ribosomal protein S11 [Ostreobium quekettii]